jgi:hypothetical protein
MTEYIESILKKGRILRKMAPTEKDATSIPQLNVI